jgi:hypothetical protein
MSSIFAMCQRRKLKKRILLRNQKITLSTHNSKQGSIRVYYLHAPLTGVAAAQPITRRTVSRLLKLISRQINHTLCTFKVQK